MVRLSALILQRDKRSVLCCLGDLGVMQLTRSSAENASLVVRNEPQELARCQQVLDRVAELRKALEIPPTTQTFFAIAEFSVNQSEENLHFVESRAGVLLNERRQILQRLAEIAETGQRLSAYSGLNFPLTRPDEYSFLHFVTGTMPAGALEKLEIGRNAAVLPLSERNGRQTLIGVTTRGDRAALEAALQRLGFESENLPVGEGATPEMLSDQNRREREQLESELANVNEQLGLLKTEFRQALVIIENHITTESRLLEAAQYFSCTESAVLLTGWIPSADSLEVQNRLRNVTSGHCVIEITSPNLSDAEIPILLRPARWLRPFQRLVESYGLPQYQELEPTLFVAVSFVLMFGVMFGDVGQGAVLAIGALIGLLRWKRLRDAFWLLLAAGISSMAFGLFYGSYFGLPSLKKFALWREPLGGDPMTFMLVAIGAGVVMISFGLILNIINRFRRHDFLGAWLDRFGVSGLVFYWGALILLARLPAIKSLNLLVPAIVAFLALPVIAWVIKEPLEFLRARRVGLAVEEGSGWFAAITQSFVGAFEGMLSFLANTVSFVRLAAYAMSHAALLLAIFLVADAMKRLPVAGTFMSVVVIALGSAVVIVLEGIIATVQALRLEYYEFFSKFFSGAGRPFKPFRLQVCKPKAVADTPL